MVDQTCMDAALARVGGWKRWHIAMYVLITPSYMLPLCWQGISIIFQGWETTHKCIGSKSSPHQVDIHNLRKHNVHLSDLREWNISNPDPRCQFVILNESTGNVTSEKCNAWSYDNGGYLSIVEQWDLVCTRNYMVELSQSLHQLGFIIGGSLCFVVDIYGRKKIHIITHFFVAFVGLVSAYSVSYFMFIISRTLLGIFVAINANSGSMLSLEFFGSKCRTLSCIMSESVWTLLCIGLVGLAYIIKNWSHLQISTSLTSPLFALMVVLVPESVTWLASKGRIEEANNILRNIAKWNNIKLHFAETLFPEVASEGTTPQHKSKDFSLENKSAVQDFTAENQTGRNDAISAEDKKRCSMVQKLADPLILKLLAISCTFWFGLCLVYFGVVFSTPIMTGNRFVNFLILSLVELPSPPVAYFLCTKVGRRMTSSISLFVSGCFLALAADLHSISESTKWLNLVLIIISKTFMTGTYAVMLLYTKEYFPTEIRATCYGICQMCGRVGSLLAPFIGYMIKANFKWLPNVILALSSLVVSLLIPFLPETKDQPLPETLEDCHKLCDQKPLWSPCYDIFKKTGKAMRKHYMRLS